MTKTNHKTNTQRSVPKQVQTSGRGATAVPTYEDGRVPTCQSNGQSSGADEAAVRCLAHSKWVAAGCPPGDGVEFWLDAEQELHGQRSA